MIYNVRLIVVYINYLDYIRRKLIDMKNQVGRPKSEPTKVIGFRVPFCQIKEVQELVRNYLHKKNKNES